MSLANLFESSFDEVLTLGAHTRKVRLSKNLTVTLAPLTEDKIMSVKLSIPEGAKKDVLTYQTIESFEKLARSIVEINDINILEAAKEDVKDDKTISAEDLALKTVRKYIGKLSQKMIGYMQEEYNELILTQYKSLKKDLGEEIENF